MRQDKRDRISNLPNAEDNKALRLNKKEEGMLLRKHVRDIYKKISSLKMQKEKLDWNTFEGSCDEFGRLTRRLDSAIKTQEDELKEAEDMLLLYEKEIPMNEEDFGLHCAQVNDWAKSDAFSTYR